jgi:serine protease Do
MKVSQIICVGIAVFAGVLGAEQVNHFLTSRQPESTPDLLPLDSSAPKSSSLVSADYKTDPIPAAPFDFRAAAKKVSGSVVSVDRYEKVQSFGFFASPDDGRIAETGQGSGVIVSTNGTIVTNNHVVTDERTGQVVPQVKVRLSDNRTFEAKVLGHDARSDLAVIKIDAPNLTAIELGTSTGVEVGQWVLAVGNPLGFSNTVSVGVVSSLKRSLPVGEQGMFDAIQTDAAINPGNSGGALCDSQGKLIGINAAIASGTGQSVGIGFAIPVDRVKVVVNDIVKFGYAKYAGLGVQYNPRLDLSDPQIQAELANQVGVERAPNSGIIVMEAFGSSLSAGIHQYDVIESIDGHKVERVLDMNQILIPKKPGDKVSVKYWSKGEEHTTTVTLQEMSGQPA